MTLTPRSHQCSATNRTSTAGTPIARPTALERRQGADSHRTRSGPCGDPDAPRVAPSTCCAVSGAARAWVRSADILDVVRVEPEQPVLLAPPDQPIGPPARQRVMLAPDSSSDEDTATAYHVV